MSRSKGRLLFIALMGLAVLLAACTGPSQETAPPITSGTGLAVAPEFEAYYNQYGGAPVFGFPITNPFVDSENGRLIQYFQHLHLEYDRAAQIVYVRPLGERFVPPQEEQTPVPPAENGRQRLFPETGYTVQDEFLVFYEANGDQAVFGLPITPQLDEGGRLVQYFQNAQLVWNPNALPEFRVEIAPLGGTYLWRFGSEEDGGFGLSNSAAVTEADIIATVKEPILYVGEEQVLYVSVITPGSMQMVSQATVNVTISYAGVTTTVFPPLTDEFGRTQIVLDLPAIEPGQKVEVEVEAISAAGLSLGTTTLSFQTWY